MPDGRFHRNTSWTPFASSRTDFEGFRFVASDWKKTNSPASEIVGSPDAPLPIEVAFDFETQVCLTRLPFMSASATSETPLRSPLSRFDASVWYATKRPSSETLGVLDAPLPAFLARVAETSAVPKRRTCLPLWWPRL